MDLHALEGEAAWGNQKESNRIILYGSVVDFKKYMNFCSFDINNS